MSEPAPDAVAVVEELARRHQAGDGAGSVALLHPDLRIQQPESFPHGGWHDGLAGMQQMGSIFSTYWDREIRDFRVFGSGDRAVQVTTQTWTAKATGRAATVDVAELITVTDGRVSEIRVFQQDSHLLLATLNEW
jgi:uncharacterized protein